MEIIEKPKYKVSPSDSPEWIIIESEDGLKVDTEVKILNFRHECIPKGFSHDGEEVICSFLCCYGGCYASQEEIDRIAKILNKIKPDLQEDSVKYLINKKNKFYDPNDFDKEEKVMKIVCVPDEWLYEDNPSLEKIDKKELEKLMEIEFKYPPKNHCVFLMKNGYCAVHKYYVDHGEKWFARDKKFNICTTFPLDLRPQDMTFGFMDEVDDYVFMEVPCISSDEKMKEQLGMRYVIDSMKEVIIDRFSESYWDALNQVGKDWRAKKIKLVQLDDDELSILLNNKPQSQ